MKKTQDLSAYTVFADGTSSKGKFDYTIESDNAGLHEVNAEIDGDVRTIPDTAPAGEYTLTIKAAEKEPELSLMSVDFGTETFTFEVTVTVNKADPTVTAPTAKTDLVYTGEAQELITAGSALGGTLQYSLDGNNWSEDIPTGTEAGDYTVYYKVTGESNYNDIEPSNVKATISKTLPTDEPSKPTQPPTDEPSKYSVAYNGGNVTVTAPEAGTYCVIFAAYKDGALVSIKAADVTFDEAGILTVEKPDGFDNSSADTVKVFFWSNLSDMRPLCAGDVRM